MVNLQFSKQLYKCEMQGSSLFEPDLEELTKKFATSIQAGEKELAWQLLDQLLQQKPKLHIRVLKEENDLRSREKELSLKVHVEDRDSQGCDFSLMVKSSDTVGDLKRKIYLIYSIPMEVQRWIIGHRIPDDSVTLYGCGIKKDGFSVFLYIVKARSIGLTRENSKASSSASAPSRNNLVMQLPECPMGAAAVSSAAVKDALSSLSSSTGQLTLSSLGQKLGSSTLLVSEPSNRQGSMLAASSGSVVANLEMVNVTQHIQPVNESVLLTALPAVEEAKMDEEEEWPHWTCTSCTFHNLPTWPGCKICSTDRPASYVVPDNYDMSEEEERRLANDSEHERLTREAEDHQLEENYRHWLDTDGVNLFPNPESCTCPICFEDTPAGHGIVLRECLHTFCRDCVTAAVMHCDEPVLKCPYQDNQYTCESFLSEREVKALVPPDVYKKYLQRSLDQAESQAQNSYHCKTADCHGWCIYEDQVNFFMCPVCGMQNCLTCKAIHVGMNCRQYQDDIQWKSEIDDAARQTKILFEHLLATEAAMHCPKCQVILQKKDGCDWIKCSICKLEICWVTKGPRWGPNGNGDISGGCQCRIGGKKCHVNCNNCH